VAITRLDQPRLPQHVELVRFDEQVAFAARAALVAFVFWHRPDLARTGDS
jgi:pterin-4a-carbinolamine dehydratase